MLKLLRWIKTNTINLFYLCLIEVNSAFANSPIPITSGEDLQNDESIGDFAMEVIKKDIIPAIVFISAFVFIYLAISGLIRGYQDYQREKDLAPLKAAIGACIIIISIGGGLMYFLLALQKFTFSSN